MRRLTILLFSFMICVVGFAQDYQIRSAGKSKTGGYIVEVEAYVKKDPKNTAMDIALKSAVRGVMFRGVMSANGLTDHKPLIQDPSVEHNKAAFFDAFFNEGLYKRYATVVDSSLSTMKNKQTKMYEIEATVIVDKEALLQYLEESDIINGFSDLW